MVSVRLVPAPLMTRPLPGTSAELKEEVHARVHRHMKVGLILLAAILALALWRWRIHTNSELTVGWSYLIAALLAVALTTLQGWLGGELVYSDGVFVRQAPSGRPMGMRKKHLMKK